MPGSRCTSRNRQKISDPVSALHPLEGAEVSIRGAPELALATAYAAAPARTKEERDASHPARQLKHHPAEMLQLFDADFFGRAAGKSGMVTAAGVLVDRLKVVERTLVNMIGWCVVENSDDLFQTGGLTKQARITLTGLC